MRLFEKIIFGVIIITLIVHGFTDFKIAPFVLIVSLFLIVLYNILFGCIIYNEIPFNKILDRDSYKDISQIRLIATIAFGFIIGFEMFLLLYGIIMKINRAPGGSYIILASIVLTLITTLISFFLRRKHIVFKRLFDKSLIVFGASILIAVIVFFGINM